MVCRLPDYVVFPSELRTTAHTPASHLSPLLWPWSCPSHIFMEMKAWELISSHQTSSSLSPLSLTTGQRTLPRDSQSAAPADSMEPSAVLPFPRPSWNLTYAFYFPIASHGVPHFHKVHSVRFPPDSLWTVQYPSIYGMEGPHSTDFESPALSAWVSRKSK